jgi:tetratricopeptide (TPR) repeat protein
MLQVAALTGRKIDLLILAKVFPMADIPGWVQRCAESAVIEIVAEQWRFAHDRIRESVLNDLPKAQEIVWYSLVAFAAEQLYADQAANAPLLAHYFYQAGAWDQAAQYAIRAGEAAAALFANTTAAAHYQQALESIGKLPETESQRLRRVDLILRYDDVSFLFDNPQERLTRLQLAETIARTLPSFDGMRRLAQIYLQMSRLYNTLSDLQNSLHYNFQAFALAQSLGDDYLLAIPTTIMGIVAAQQGQFSEARSHFARSLPTLLKTENWEFWTLAHAYQLLSLGAQGETIAFDQTLRGALDKLHELDNPTMLAQIYAVAALGALTLGQPERALQLTEAALQAAHRSGDRALEVTALYFAAIAHFRRGDLDEASRQWEASNALAATLGGLLFMQAWIKTFECEWRIALGQVEAAHAQLLSLLNHVQIQSSRYIQGLIHLYLFQITRDTAAFDQAQPLLRESGARPDLARLLLLRGEESDRTEAEQILAAIRLQSEP